MNVDAITGAIRGVLTGTVGTIRVVAAGKFTELVHGDTSDPEVWIRGRQGAAGTLQAMADVRLGVPERTGFIGNPAADRNVWELPLDVHLYYASLPYSDLVPARRHDIRAQAAEDVVTLALALTWPGNLLTDASAVATGIVSGILHPRGEARVDREEWSDEIGLLEMSIPFTAWVTETQAIA